MRWPDGHRVDNSRLQHETEVRNGSVPLADFARLAQACADPEQVRGELQWRTELRPVARYRGEFDLWLSARAELPLPCRRCLDAVPTEITARRRYRLLPDEDAVALRDEQAEDHEVIWLDPALDINSLIEDEMLLALPMMPAHQVCPGEARDLLADHLASGEEEPVEADSQRPFADLASRLGRSGR
ncbi:MAG: DUF177 domain-containing protein [Burkholderiaceae bacterium]